MAWSPYRWIIWGAIGLEFGTEVAQLIYALLIAVLAANENIQATFAFGVSLFGYDLIMAAVNWVLYLNYCYETGAETGSDTSFFASTTSYFTRLTIVNLVNFLFNVIYYAKFLGFGQPDPTLNPTLYPLYHNILLLQTLTATMAVWIFYDFTIVGTDIWKWACNTLVKRKSVGKKMMTDL